MAGNEVKTQQNSKSKAPKKKSRFFKEFTGEVKKLSWPTPKDLITNTLTVIAFVALFAIIIGVLDSVFGIGLKALLNLG